MADGPLTSVLRQLESNARPDPAFHDILFAALLPRAERARRRDGARFGSMLTTIAATGAAAQRIPWRPVTVLAVAASAIGMALIGAWIVGHPPPRGPMLVWTAPSEPRSGPPAPPGAPIDRLPAPIVVLDPETGAERPLGVVAHPWMYGGLSPDGRFVAVLSALRPDGGCPGVEAGPLQGQPLRCTRFGDASGFTWAGDDSVAWYGMTGTSSLDGHRARGVGFLRAGAPAGGVFTLAPGSMPSGIGWSPDGSRLAILEQYMEGSIYPRPDWSPGRLSLLDPATGDLQQVAIGLFGGPVDWTDRDRVAVTRLQDPDATTGERVLVDLVSGQVTAADAASASPGPPTGAQVDPLRRLRSPTEDDWLVTRWVAPDDGDTTGGGAQLWLVGGDGAAIRKVADGVWQGSAEWSPDGAWIAYATGPLTTACTISQGCPPEVWAASTIWIERADGSDRHVLLVGSYRFDW